MTSDFSSAAVGKDLRGVKQLALAKQGERPRALPQESALPRQRGNKDFSDV